jgi:hypothetical protein
MVSRLINRFGGLGRFAILATVLLTTAHACLGS